MLHMMVIESKGSMELFIMINVQIKTSFVIYYPQSYKV